MNPDPSKITVDHPGIVPGGEINAVEGEIFLQRVRDDKGNDFFVIFQIVAVDPYSRYMAIIWRPLPGGKRVVMKK
ncbi:MAG: hypothetical protein EXS16_19150 [Gemmataceae bacterium]|nr:hypothetical protein [Gemmataceae bacterium]